VGIKRAVELLKKHKTYVITSHTNPEGDALGSELALAALLKKLGKNAIIINEDDVPVSYQFLPGEEAIKKFRYGPKRQVFFDCLIFIDCSDARRTGEVYRINTGSKPVLNIDHHISNEKFGDVNWVEPHASSCAEMVYRLYKKMRVPLTSEAALCLYTGMMSDTGSFRYSNTRSSTHKAVAELLACGVDTVQVYKNVYENIPFEDMKLLLKLLPGIHREMDGKIVWFQIPHNLLRNKKLTFDLTEELLSFARAIKGIEVCVLFKENLGVVNEVRINLRSQGKADVNKIASLFGGGGHRTASGATIHGQIDSVRKRVLAKIRESLRKI